MSNKVDGALDFSKMKKTQFSGDMVLKSSFSELQSGIRTFTTNPILRDGYTHFVQTLNGEGYPTHVEYWQASKPSMSQLTLGADVSGSLRSTYIILEEYLTKRTVALYCVVGGTGTAPGLADLEVAVTFEENDSAAVVTYAFFNAINNNLDYFLAERVGNFASATTLNITFQQFGESSGINVGTTGFTTSVLQTGESFKVGEVFLDYDSNNNPIYNGATLKGITYNPYTASFDVDGSASGEKVQADSLIYLPDSGNSDIMYIGTAVHGTATGDAKWKIQRVDLSSGVIIQTASSTFDQVWDDRESLSYE